MSRKARIDAPGAFHHIICRGIERRKIFYDDMDRDNFLKRLENILFGLLLGGDRVRDEWHERG